MSSALRRCGGSARQPACLPDNASIHSAQSFLTGGQASDIGKGENLSAGIDAGAVLGDKGYDADPLVQALVARGNTAVISPRTSRNAPRPYGWQVCKERRPIECFFGKIEYYRRVFSRFEKSARNFLGFFKLSPLASGPGEAS